MNKYAIKRGRTGYYRVMQGRALHWPTNDGKPPIWARAGEVVDLTSPFLSEVAQRTGQFHKLEKLEGEPGNKDKVVSRKDIPPSVRARLEAYEAGQPGAAKPTRPEDGRKVDLGQLPSAKDEPEKGEPEKSESKAKPTPKTKAEPKGKPGPKGGA